MNVLVVNIGSTSFKFRLLDMADERVLAAGAVEGVGKPMARVTLQCTGHESSVTQRPIASQSDAVALCLTELESGAHSPGTGDPPTGTTSAKFAAIQKADAALWAPAVKASGFTPQQ